MKKHAGSTGINHFHLHRFRHAFVRIVAEEAGNLIEAQEALGHESFDHNVDIHQPRTALEKTSTAVNGNIPDFNFAERRSISEPFAI